MNKEDIILKMLAAMRSKMDARFTKLEAAQAEMQETLTRVAVTQEGRFCPKSSYCLKVTANLLKPWQTAPLA